MKIENLHIQFVSVEYAVSDALIWFEPYLRFILDALPGNRLRKFSLTRLLLLLLLPLDVALTDAKTFRGEDAVEPYRGNCVKHLRRDETSMRRLLCRGVVCEGGLGK